MIDGTIYLFEWFIVIIIALFITKSFNLIAHFTFTLMLYSRAVRPNQKQSKCVTSTEHFSVATVYIYRYNKESLIIIILLTKLWKDLIQKQKWPSLHLSSSCTLFQSAADFCPLSACILLKQENKNLVCFSKVFNSISIIRSQSLTAE